ncbi:hypothetical protein TanjilG_30628 [Lupinus angustifolius]|uniref:B-like cyclin n=1 Tax=Lupinus angustifolius TaxID=3871 RepID=A0A4P1RPB1_LUPAN|nr:PREDICTED: cyclin-D5-3-like [Lupinus angustifolius]OIW14909.1 hypothetical protein TanjilG_30628 [Lupinus angustifolius]
MDDGVSSSQMCFELEFGDEEVQLSLEDYGVSEDEHLGILIEKEIHLCFKKDQALVSDEWMKRARIDAIIWILKTRAALGFRLQTAYLSVTYFDRFISTRSINSEKHWAIRLLSVACISIAAKMEECNVPCLPEFQLEDYCFESKVIQRMELFVLTTLEWDMAIVTPFVFLPYFIPKLCNESQPNNILYKTTMQLIFTTMKEVNLMDRKPSVIATSATLVALDQQLTIEDVELKINSIPQHRRFLELKDVFDCYNIIQRLYKERTRRDKLLHTPGSSPILSKPIDMTENSLVNSATMSKRRRLTFDDDKQGGDGNGSDSTKENPKL